MMVKVRFQSPGPTNIGGGLVQRFAKIPPHGAAVITRVNREKNRQANRQAKKSCLWSSAVRF